MSTQDFNQQEIEQALFQINGYFGPDSHRDGKIRKGDPAVLQAEFDKAKSTVLYWMQHRMDCVAAMTVERYLGKYPRTNRDLYDDSVPMEI